VRPRLGINGWRIHGQRTGVGRYLLNVVRHWTREAVADRFSKVTIYTARPLDRAEVPLPENVCEVVLRSDHPMLVWENLRLAGAATDDVLFCPSYSRPLRARARTVVATADAVSVLHPELFPPAVRLFYNPLYGWSARHATRVVAATEASRQDIGRGWGVPLDKIRAVPLAPAEEFRPMDDRAAMAQARARHVGGDAPFFLFVGKLSGRRSLPPLLEAFALLKRAGSPHKLLLVGLNPRQLDLARLAADLGVQADVKHAGYVTDAELAALYNAAEAFVMPSVYETVSLPVMEAQASGTPVICIDTPGMREVTGGAALLVPRLDKQPLLEAMAILAADPQRRRQLSADGLVNARRYSWRRCSAETLDILHEAARC
jgi:glycosyltransferase involved in cell wall biosynthesis